MINSVTESSERNEYSEKRPSAVYIIDYNYTNLGYYDSVFDGLFLSSFWCFVTILLNLTTGLNSYKTDSNSYSIGHSFKVTFKASHMTSL